MEAQLIGEPRRLATDGRLYALFFALFNARPMLEDMIDAQVKAGYHPCGYGGPSQVHIRQLSCKVFAVTWTSSGTCD